MKYTKYIFQRTITTKQRWNDKSCIKKFLPKVTKSKAVQSEGRLPPASLHTLRRLLWFWWVFNNFCLYIDGFKHMTFRLNEVLLYISMWFVGCCLRSHSGIAAMAANPGRHSPAGYSSTTERMPHAHGRRISWPECPAPGGWRPSAFEWGSVTGILNNIFPGILL